MNARSGAPGSSGSFLPESKLQGKSDVWKGYDYDNLPELTDDQLKTFRRVTEVEHDQFKMLVARGRRGRPKKPADKKEKVHSIRFSDAFLEKLKLKASREGFTAWQTYAKKIISDHLA